MFVLIVLQLLNVLANEALKEIPICLILNDVLVNYFSPPSINFTPVN